MTLRLRTAILTAFLLPAGLPVAWAQTGTPGPRALAPGVQIQVETPGGAPAAADRIDETALRYYARIGDVARLEAEIARLKAIDPSWEPPRDLFAPQAAQPAVDETPIWTLLSAGKPADARAAIAEQRRAVPSWQPSEKLLTELDLAEAGQRLREASDAKRWQDVVDTAAAEPRLLTCARLDNLWRTADAYGELKQTDRAFDLYRTVVTTCPKAQERRDTLFKASRYLPAERVRELADLAATASPAAGEDYAIVRNALEELDVGRTLERLGAPGITPSAEDLARAEASVIERRDADAALALGWYRQNRKEYAAARDWFRRANEWAPGDRAVEGLVLALAGLGEREEAVAAAAPWRGRSERVDRVLRAVVRPSGGGGGGGGPRGPSALDRALAARDWSACLSAIETEKRAGRYGAALAQQRGWCLMELKRPTEAEIAFAEAERLAARAPAAERKRLADVAEFGGLVARLRQDDTAGVLQDLPGSGLTPARQREVRAAALAQQALRAYDEQRFRDALRLLDARRELEPEPRGLTLIRAWALYGAKRLQEALELFEALDRRLSSDETRKAIDVVRQVIYNDG